MKIIFVNILAFGTLLSSIFSIISKNSIILVIFLIATFVTEAGYLILIEIHFVGLSYIIVYVGVIAVLFLFVILLINIKLTDITETGNQYLKNLPLALTVSSLFLFIIFSIVPFSSNNITIIFYVLSLFNTMNSLILSSNISATTDTASVITNHSLKVDTLLTTFSQIETLDIVLYANQSILLIILSIILLLAMFSSIVLNNVNQKKKL